MLIRFQDLTTLDLVASDGTRHRVQDVFIDEDALRITHVVADFGGWFTDRTGVIGIGRFGQPDIASTTWPCTLDEEALQERVDRDPNEPSPMLVPSGSDAAPHHLGETPGGKLRSVRALTDETEVAASDGYLGRLMGMIFDIEGWHARYLVVSTGEHGSLPTHQRVYETGLLAERDFDGGRVTLSCSRAEAEKALDLHELDDVEGKWYNKVLAYYGFER